MTNQPFSIFAILALSAGCSLAAALVGTEGFESGFPAGGTGWTTDWVTMAPDGGGTFLESGDPIVGANSLGMYGNGGHTWARREHLHQEGSSIIPKYWSYNYQMKAGFDLNDDGDINVTSRLGLTIREGNDTSLNAFVGEVFSIYFEEGTTDLQYFSGVGGVGGVHATSEVTFNPDDIYNVRVTLRPRFQQWELDVANYGPDGTGSADQRFTSTGTYSAAQGHDLDSLLFYMRGPVGVGNDVFFDALTVTRNIPEPGTVGFLGIGFLVLNGVRRRRKQWAPPREA